jgi:hypothetical protein
MTLLTTLGRMGRVWIAVELSAGILALCLVISVLPAILCLLALPPEFGWKIALGASVNSTAGAAFLGRIALALPAELLTARAPPPSP